MLLLQPCLPVKMLLSHLCYFLALLTSTHLVNPLQNFARLTLISDFLAVNLRFPLSVSLTEHVSLYKDYQALTT